MKKSEQMFATVAGLAIATLWLATNAGATIVEQFNFNHGVQAATAEPVYTPVSGETLGGATYNLQGTLGSFVNSPPPLSAKVTGQSWYNTYQGYGDVGAACEGYQSVNAPTVTGSFTVEAMVRLSAPLASVQEIFASSDPAQSGSYVSGFTACYISGGQVCFNAAWSGNTASPYFAQTSLTLSLDQWYDLGFVYDATTGAQTIYVDGVPAASAASSVGPQPTLLSIGSAQNLASTAGNPGLNLVGYLDGLVISDQALDPSQFVLLNAVPEPSVFLLLGLGGAIVAAARRRRLAAAKA